MCGSWPAPTHLAMTVATGMLSGAEHRLVPSQPADPGRPVQPGDASAPESV